jgi:RHS repeat-associated protein
MVNDAAAAAEPADPGTRSSDSRFRPPVIVPPQGGGAIRGIGERFTANPVTGTGSITVPIATSPGRSGFGPTLALNYDSGYGNGPFGLGWSLQLPTITRRTDQMLPLYCDAEESDVFLLSGVEDLVPVLDGRHDGGQQVRNEPASAPEYRVDRYRPRIEGVFDRIERWTRLDDGQVHWRSITSDNITTVYGADPNSRISNPADSTRVFSWLICLSYDDRGNAIAYEYKAENSEGIDPGLTHEAHRTVTGRTANRYLKRIRYGNRTSRLSDPTLSAPDWAFEVVFDYGDHDPTTPTSQDTRPWLCRHDPFSQYRPGFEVRTYRLCQRVLMFHHFPLEPGVGAECLVQSTDLAYASLRSVPGDTSHGHPLLTLLASVTHRGYRRRTSGGYLTRSLPPVEFDYSPARFHDQVTDVDPDSLVNLPTGLASGAHWVDLDGEGICGVLTEQADAWFYKANLGNGRFAATETLPTVPSLRSLGSGRQQLIDLAGTGTLDAVNYAGACPGFFERTTEGGWEPFRPFPVLPTIRWNDPNLHLIDLNGDGIPDVLITEADTLTWYPSLAHGGFGPARRTPLPTEDDCGPRVVFADTDQSVLAVADMSGDGLADLVRIRNGEVCYWPNLGQGHFDTKIIMDGSPWFDTPDGFDQHYLHLADVDGSGTTDLIYLAGDGARIWLNHAGNSFADPVPITSLPPVDALTSILVTDFLGQGTACLVWSSPLPGDANHAMRYVNLMGTTKPYLLVTMRNNFGAETHIDYTSSTKFFLADKATGRPWITRLPFPVHVVDRVEVVDRISRNHFVTRYAYHHGYFDPIEQEFRGFGMVEQWDTEKLSALAAADPTQATNLDPAYNLPPVWTKTWFHTGSSTTTGGLSRQYEGEYYRESGLTDAQAEAMLLPDTVLPDTVLHPDASRTAVTLSPTEIREAARALKGSILRQEIYALDGTDAHTRPYQVTENNYTIELLQPLAGNRHAVCFVHPRETVTFAYERALYDITSAEGGLIRVADPRVTHQVTLDVDGYGNVLRSAAIAYPRRHPDPAADLDQATRDALHAEQARLLATLTENTYTNPLDDPTTYRTPLPAQTRTFDLVHLHPEHSERVDPAATNLISITALRRQADAASDGAHDLPYEDLDHTKATTSDPYRRLLTQTRTLYRRDDLTAALPLGQLQSRALPFAHYTLAFTPGLLTQIYQHVLPDPGAVLGTEGGYLNSEKAIAQGLFPASDPSGQWWAPSERVFYSPCSTHAPAQELAYARTHFFLPHRFTDSFANTTTVYYDRYDLLLAESQDPLGNRITVGTRDVNGTVDTDGHDYRVLAARVICDPNRNRVIVAFDTLGMVVGTAVIGKVEQVTGDSLEGFVADLDDAVVAAHLADPLTDPLTILGNATTRLVYDLFAYHRSAKDAQPQPAVTYSLARETHVTDLTVEQPTKVQHALSYLDGFGREIQHKAPAEPGPITEGGPVGPVALPRWVGTGWTIFNNKGTPVRQHEPFFTATHHFEFASTVGVSSVLFYDPLERVVATLHPNDTYTKLVIDPWSQATWDVNDTVLLDPRTDPDVGDVMRSYLATLPADWKSWYARRHDGGLGPDELDAATKTAVHANTPTVAYTDPLARLFLTVAHNTITRNDATIQQERYSNRVVLDIQGNPRAVLDPLHRTVMHYQSTMTAQPLRTASADAGETITVVDVTGEPIRVFDSRGHATRLTYDPLRRPQRSYIQTGTGPERLRERTVYGETHPNAEKFNLRTRPHLHFDGAGVVVAAEHDFTGNLLRVHRRLAITYQEETDWSTLNATDATLIGNLPDTLLTGEDFSTTTTYDALNRPTTMTAPDTSVIRPTYNEATLLERLDVQLRGATDHGAPVWTPFITNLHYNAAGQRILLACGNGASTTYTYDPLTFRLTQLITRRGAAFPADCPNSTTPTCGVQNLRYTYDPSANITRITDNAQQTVFFNNTVVTPHTDYTYDAVYQLTTATGREHIGQQKQPPQPTWNDAARTGLPHPQDGTAMRRYTQTYNYDQVGNLLTLIHQAGPTGGWTRTYSYKQTSTLVPEETNNQLSSTTVSRTTESYTYDAHGNITSMSHLTAMDWDDHDRFHRAGLGGGGTVYYTYDSHGQRVRAIVDRPNGTRKNERIYLDGFEIYREYDGTGKTVTLERQTLHIMDDEHRIALVETRTRGSDPGLAQVTRYQYDNHLGSACLELDEKAALISYEEYYPYGGTSYQAVRNQTETKKRYRYTGKERDTETGFTYHGARYYAPWIGRWTSPDPAHLIDGPNLYQFTRNNPITLTDRSGLVGEPGSENLDIVYRVLRSDERPLTGGLRPRPGHDLNISPAMHVRFGSKAKRKSAWVSYTRSLEVATTQAAEYAKTTRRMGRVAKAYIPEEMRNQWTNLSIPEEWRNDWSDKYKRWRNEDWNNAKNKNVGWVRFRTVYDLTTEEHLNEVFGTEEEMKIWKSYATKSREVLIYGGLGRERVLNVSRAKNVVIDKERKKCEVLKKQNWQKEIIGNILTRDNSNPEMRERFYASTSSKLKPEHRVLHSTKGGAKIREQLREQLRLGTLKRPKVS